MKRLLMRGLMLTALGAGASASAALPNAVLVAAIAKARAVGETQVLPKVPGFSVAVAIDGKIVWSQGYGYADLAAKTRVTPATRFRVGSVSKPMTAAGLALLVEQGRIDLDEPVQKYLPEFPVKKGVITTRMLAGHLSGLRNYRGTEALSNQPFPNLLSGLKLFELDPLDSVPGSKFSYSSYNWNVIGAEIEHVTQQDFPGYMADHVFKPLGMTATGADYAGKADPGRAQFYEVDRMGKFIAAPPVDNSYKWPSGGFLSTSEDLTRFGSAMLQPGFLQQKSLDVLFTSQKTTGGKLTGYGLGWFIVKNTLNHGGDATGGSAILYLVPASRMVVAMACNRGHITFGWFSGKMILEKSSAPFSSSFLLKQAEQIAKIFAPVAAGKST